MRVRMRRLRIALSVLIGLSGLSGRAFAASEDPTHLRSEAFEAAQSASASVAAAALAKVAAAFAAGGDALAALERARAADVQQLASDEKQFTDLLGDQQPERVRRRDELAREAEALRQRIRQDEAGIERLNPAYYELTRPHALSLSSTQALLNPDEALLMLLSAEDATYIFAVSRDRSAWARAPDLGEAALARAVRDLRDGLEMDAVRGEPAQPRQRARAVTFDPALAFRLYDALIRPVESILQGKRAVISVATGPLVALPLALLTTEPPPAAGARGAQPHYLIDRYALTTLPAVSSLQALRCLLVTPARRHAGCAAASGAAPPEEARPRIELVGFGAPALQGLPGTTKSAAASFAHAFRGPLADTNYLRALPPLEGSRRELEEVGREYGRRALIVTGPAATETEVKRNAALRRARYVIFSTHGLLAGEGGVDGEPGLVFTPPAESAKSALDDGLLTASEAAHLSLDADFVILSACNTAAAGGQTGGEGLSGLARAFFYAGARSILVSHWEVSDRATELLVSRTLASVRNDAGADRSEALRRGIAAVRADPRWRSPGFWAAFTLIGLPD